LYVIFLILKFKSVSCYAINMSSDFTKPVTSSHLGISDLQVQPESSSLKERVSKEHPSIAHRVGNAILFVFVSFSILGLALLNSPWTLIARAVSYYKHKSLSDGIEKAQIQKLAEGLDLVIEGDLLGEIAQADRPGRTIGSFSKEELTANIFEQQDGVNEKSAAALVEKVLRIKEKIVELKAKGSSFWLDVAAIREAIADVMNMQIYRDLAKNPDCYAVNFLQCLVVKLIAANGTETLREYGKECLNKARFDESPGRTFQPEELADQLSGYLNLPSFNFNSFFGEIIWAAAHPWNAIHALHSATHPLSYDSGQGNPRFSAHSFEMEGKKKIQFYYGPGPTGDPLFEYGLLPAYEKFNTFELRFNHQDTHNPKDHLRIQDAIRMKNHQHLHAVISFNKPWAAAICSEFQSVEDFFSSFKANVKKSLRELEDPKKDRGYYIPEELLSDSAVDLALSKAEEFSKKLASESSHWSSALKDSEGKKRMGTMMMLIADSFLTLGMLYYSFDGITSQMIENLANDRLDKDLYAIRSSGACKQDVDRAVIENITLRLFFRWTSDPSPLTADEVCEIAGAVFGRGRIVDDRNIKMKCYQILDDLLRFVGGIPDGKGVSAAHEILKGYQDALNPKSVASASNSPGSWFSFFTETH
jgi:hypothetical protein